MTDPQRPAEGRLETAAVRGVPWTVVGFAGGKAVGLLATFALARLLDPTDFGLVALAGVALGAMGMFSDLGLGGVLVVRQDLDRRAMGTVLTLMIGMGAALFALIATLSPLVGRLLDEPRLAPVLAVLAAGLLLGSVTWFYEMVLQRELAFVARFKAVLAQSIVTAAVSIASAALGAGVWSLVAGQLAGTATYAIGLLLVSPYRVAPAFDRSAARQALRDGSGFVAQSGLAFVELNVDNLAVGRLLGAGQLGLYSMAFRIAETPYWAITEPVAKVTFPGFARMTAREESVRNSFLSVLKLVTLVACPVGVLLSAVADPFTRTVLGPSWTAMIATLSVLGIWGTINNFEATLGWLLNSVGEASLNAVISAAAVAALVPAVVAAAALWGIESVAWVLLGHVVLSALARGWCLDSRLGVRWRAQLTAIRPAVIGSAAAWATGKTMVLVTSGAPSAVSLVVSAVAGACVYLLVISVVERGVIRWATGRVRRTVATDRLDRQ